MITAELLEVLCCPETQLPVRLAEPAVLEKLNCEIEAGTLKNRAGKPVLAKLSAGLLRVDGKWLYPIRADIPLMLIEEALPVGWPPG